MEIIWDPSRRFRGFIAEELQHVAIVSSVVNGEATTDCGPGLLISVNDEMRFSDLQVNAKDAPRDDALAPPPASAEVVTTELRTQIETPAETRWTRNGEWVVVAFAARTPQKWLRLGTTPVFVAVDGDNVVGMACCEMTDDPTGEGEMGWLADAERD